MKIDIEVISREIIKPATSTDLDPIQHYKFSFLDQMHPSAIYTPLIYFYGRDDDLKLSSNSEKSTQLKTSLSQVLKHYYHLAGVIKDDYHIDCSNGGVRFWEAQVNCQLAEFLQNPNPTKFINKFLPDVDANNSLLLAIQANFFTCGGIAIGVRLSHKVADGSSFITFINKWAETARGNGDQIVAPYIVGAALFPPLSDGFNYCESPTENNTIAFKRFPVYEADFGWGRPKWVAFGNLFQRNHVMLMDTRDGDGIEAWIRLKEEDMAIFESDKELLTYASPNPLGP